VDDPNPDPNPNPNPNPNPTLAAATYAGISGAVVQVLRVIPYSAAQLYSYELFKRRFRDPETGGLSVRRRLAAGACAGMASTVVRFLTLNPYLTLTLILILTLALTLTLTVTLT